MVIINMILVFWPLIYKFMLDMQVLSHGNTIDFQMRNSGGHSWWLSYGRFSIVAGLCASLTILPVLPAIEGMQSLVGMSA